MIGSAVIGAFSQKSAVKPAKKTLSSRGSPVYLLGGPKSKPFSELNSKNSCCLSYSNLGTSTSVSGIAERSCYFLVLPKERKNIKKKSLQKALTKPNHLSPKHFYLHTHIRSFIPCNPCQISNIIISQMIHNVRSS